MRIDIRPMEPKDAHAISRMAFRHGHYLNELGDNIDPQLTPQKFLEDGFGEDPAFWGWVAQEKNSALQGYLLYTKSYDTDRAVRYLFVIDLWVEEAQRGKGTGQALMQHLHRWASDRNFAYLKWDVYRPNIKAKAFYKKLGAEEDQVDCMIWE